MLDTNIIQSLDADQAFNKLLMIQKTLHESTTPDSLVAFYDQDETFHDMFNYDGNAIENIDAYIEASNEGMLQDFLRFGLSGLIAGLYYSSLGRIRSVCEKYRDSTDLGVENKTSLYLPDYYKFSQAIKKIDALFDACSKFQKDPKANVKPIVDALRLGGANVSYNGDVQDLTGTDWKAVAGTWIGGMLFGLVGAVVGAHVASDQGGKIRNRGWDAGKIAQAAGQIADRIDKVYELKNMKPAVREDDPELGAKIRFASSAYKVYLDVLKNMGRGVASAFTIIR